MEIDRIKVRGTVKCLDCMKGLGFITPDYGGDDLTFNLSSIKSTGFCSLSEGMIVEFVVVEDDDGRIRAVEVTGLGSNSRKDESPIGVEERCLSDLPRDVLLLIFKKITAVWIIRSAQFVCRPWLLLSYDPEVWTRIDMTGFTDLLSLLDMEPMAMEAVDRSRGRLDEFYAENFGSDALMHYIGNRTTRLRSLHIKSTIFISEAGLVQVLSRYPHLEELEISLCSFSSNLIGLLGQACPHLKSFKLVEQWMLRHNSDHEGDIQALAIANHMRRLRRLQLYGFTITATGLLAILDNCAHLEYLDLRRCFKLCLDESLKKKCARIRYFRCSNNSEGDDGALFTDYDNMWY